MVRVALVEVGRWIVGSTVISHYCSPVGRYLLLGVGKEVSRAESNLVNQIDR